MAGFNRTGSQFVKINGAWISKKAYDQYKLLHPSAVQAQLPSNVVYEQKIESNSGQECDPVYGVPGPKGPNSLTTNTKTSFSGLIYGDGENVQDSGIDPQDVENLLNYVEDGNSSLIPISPIATKTSNYTVTATDEIILGDATSTSISITLLTVSGHSGKRYTIKKIDSSENTVTVATTSSQTIDGETSVVLNIQYEAITVISNGSAWFII